MRMSLVYVEVTYVFNVLGDQDRGREKLELDQNLDQEGCRSTHLPVNLVAFNLDHP